MARTRQEKEQIVKDYIEQIKSAKAVYVVEPNGVTANQSSKLKIDLFDLDASFNVVKNSLFQLAIQELGYDKSDDVSANPKAVVFTSDQVSEAAKVVKEFIKENEEKLKIIVGYLDGKQISSTQINELADLPTKDVMIAQLLATMNAPVTGLARVLNANTRDLVTVLDKIKESKSN